jgi:hypothetical protein
VTKPTSRDERAPEELDEQRGEELPERKAMSLIDGNVAGSGSAALTVLSEDSTAVAEADQPQDER